jgi:hypothetical protein
MNSNNVYNESFELKELAENLKERYYLYLGYIDLDNIFFAEVGGVKPDKANVLSLSGIKSPWVKQLVRSQESNNYLYCLSVWSEEWLDINPDKQAWLVFEALLCISFRNNGDMRSPDVFGWGIMIEYLGPYWRNKDELPSLLGEENPLPIPLPHLDEDEGDTF